MLVERNANPSLNQSPFGRRLVPHRADRQPAILQGFLNSGKPKLLMEAKIAHLKDDIQAHPVMRKGNSRFLRTSKTKLGVGTGRRGTSFVLHDHDKIFGQSRNQSISIDISGDPFHKRGKRNQVL